MSGKMNLDDAAFFFGNEKNWQTKIGRFEAYDMFPLNQDTYSILRQYRQRSVRRRLRLYLHDERRPRPAAAAAAT